jgi:hypothetical protein
MIKTLWMRKQIAQPQGMCQSFSSEQRVNGIFATRNFLQARRRILPRLGAVAHCKANYKGKNHETAS